jgi:hypothetical protein
MHVIFYSSYCKASAKLLQVLEKTGEILYFNKVCVDVDKSGKRPFIVHKYGIKKVPSIISDGTLYSGIEAFKWFSEYTRHKQTHTGVNTRDVKKIEAIKNNGTNEEDEIDVYEFKRKKSVADEAEVIGDVNSTKIVTPRDEFAQTTNKRFKKDSLKAKQSGNLYSKLLDERKKLEEELLKKQPRF